MSSGIVIVRHPRARRAKLSVDPVSGEVRLTLSLRAPVAPALRWAEEHRPWIDEQRARLPVAKPFLPGTELIVAGEVLMIIWEAALPRRVVRTPGQLICGGPLDTLSRRVTAWLRHEALTLMSAETAEFANRLGVIVKGVAVGDPRGRWGSCSASGTIRYSWRLILAPGRVRRATVAHEVAHRVEMNHGPQFHALVEQLIGSDAAISRAWLRRHGAELHWFGRDS